MRLFKTHTLTFTSGSEGYYDNDGEWQDGAKTTKDVLGSLQNMRAGGDLQKLGSSSKQLPEGYLVEDAKAFFTQSSVDMLDEDNSTEPATTIINNKTYKVWMVRTNTGFGLQADHTVVILIKPPRINSGGW